MAGLVLSIFILQHNFVFRVRYYACEALYNIAKHARDGILKYINKIFDGLCNLVADLDMDVKNGASHLDKLLKGIVTESDSFEIDTFVPLLKKQIKNKNPYIRSLLVGWITELDSVPDIEMLDYLPEFLDGLFNMLSDSNADIRSDADQALTDFLDNIQEAPFVDFGPMVPSRFALLFLGSLSFYPARFQYWFARPAARSGLTASPP